MIEREVVWIMQVRSPVEGFDAVPWGSFGRDDNVSRHKTSGWDDSLPTGPRLAINFQQSASSRRRIGEFTGIPGGVRGVGDWGSHPGHGFDALQVSTWAGKGVRKECPQGTLGAGGDPVGASFPWCHGALVRAYGQRGQSFGPHKQSHGALRIVESSNGLVGRCPFPANRKPNPDIPSSQSRVVPRGANDSGRSCDGTGASMQKELEGVLRVPGADGRSPRALVGVNPENHNCEETWRIVWHRMSMTVSEANWANYERKEGAWAWLKQYGKIFQVSLSQFKFKVELQKQEPRSNRNLTKITGQNLKLKLASPGTGTRWIVQRIAFTSGDVNSIHWL
ncbi:hypothetical protein FB451DRAFT_1180083 [Mycena latifolia]|nr:hypothetical protein FB451DRAFT_1180083 [Mycena latifolia]